MKPEEYIVRQARAYFIQDLIGSLSGKPATTSLGDSYLFNVKELIKLLLKEKERVEQIELQIFESRLEKK